MEPAVPAKAGKDLSFIVTEFAYFLRRVLDRSFAALRMT